jgi:hypothetical protein
MPLKALIEIVLGISKLRAFVTNAAIGALMCINAAGDVFSRVLEDANGAPLFGGAPL